MAVTTPRPRTRLRPDGAASTNGAGAVADLGDPRDQAFARLAAVYDAPQR